MAKLLEVVGANLKRLRKERGLTMQELAKRADVNQGSISRLETGNLDNVTSALLGKLAAGLECDESDLFHPGGAPRTIERIVDKRDVFEAIELVAEFMQAIRDGDFQNALVIEFLNAKGTPKQAAAIRKALRRLDGKD